MVEAIKKGQVEANKNGLVDAINCNEELIAEYAKKIYGFAYSKTGNVNDADDLSQEILMSLLTIRFDEKQIENIGAYIYRVAQYTWAKYLRKSKPAFECLGSEDALALIEADGDLESDSIKRAEDKELYEKLRAAVMSLGRTRREAVILFYYDAKSGEEISRLLGIPAATVRWHLFSAKKEIKERVTMNVQSEIYRPIKLSVGHYGWQDNDVLRRLESDILMQNVCYICFGKALTVEEISHTLGVAAVYLEDMLDKLVGMEYMTKSAKNKYSTAFFIRSAEYQLAHSRYQFEKAPPLARAYYDVVKAAFPEIMKLGFTGADIDGDILMWDLTLYFMMREIGDTDNRMIQTLNLPHGAPIRPDGTRHWVRAAVHCDELLNDESLAGDDFRTIFRDANGFGIKSSNITPVNVRGLQFDSPFVSEWRAFEMGDITALRRLRELINGEEAGELDRAAVAGLIEKGYAKREKGELHTLVPYFDKAQKETLDRVLKEKADKTLDREAELNLFTGYAEEMKKLIPPCVCENERNHYLTSFDPHNAVLYTLMKEGLLRTPTESERKYICMVMWDF